MATLTLTFLDFLEKVFVRLCSVGALGLVFTLFLIGIKRLWQKHLHAR